MWQPNIRRLLFSSTILVLIGSCSTQQRHINLPSSAWTNANSQVICPTPPPIPTPRRLTASRSGNAPAYTQDGVTYIVRDVPIGTEIRGIASWYGPNFVGKPTAVGTSFNPCALTAAHKTLPLPSYASVTNALTGQTVTVLINDRGPFVDNREIDLSFAAAQAIGIVDAGTAPVHIRILATPHNHVTPTSVWLQAGVFRERVNAEKQYLALQNYFEDNIIRIDSSRGHHRVFVGPLPVATAARLRERLLGYNISTIPIASYCSAQTAKETIC